MVLCVKKSFRQIHQVGLIYLIDYLNIKYIFYLAPLNLQAVATARKTSTLPPSLSLLSDDCSSKQRHHYRTDGFHFMKVLGKESFVKVIPLFFETSSLLFNIRYIHIFHYNE